MPYEFYYSKWWSGRVKINASSAGVITKWVCISNRCCTAASQPQSEAQQVCTSIRIQPQKNCLHLWGEAGCYRLPCIVDLVPPCCLCFTPMSRHGHDFVCVSFVRHCSSAVMMLLYPGCSGGFKIILRGFSCTSRQFQSLLLVHP